MAGIKVIGLHSNPGYQIHMKETKVVRPADFKGKKMRVPSKIAGTILKTLGAILSGSIIEIKLAHFVASLISIQLNWLFSTLFHFALVS